ncbi:PQQ-dependent sugar dehydrogenase [Ensifer sp. ENS07]|uniref:PQQ-dependent sugar dehydrogenase n=1 Tax=Ensifer sp. ENS07 TaxID=2769274 RepID=UPI00177BCCD5|nr:PQQ-dependent sugar dehydrogenase [Ensifer sp. ENS07]MBD9638847.1 PQQ-dependent sugar dehydrogenase [Ensifer sp. ENS07]
MRHSRFIEALAAIAVGFFLQSTVHAESINAGGRKASSNRPFAIKTAAEFSTPWAVAFIPDGRMLVTEKPRRIFLTTQSGERREVGNVPAVAASGQNGLLDIAVAPDFAESSLIYITYVEPGDSGSRLVLARATLSIADMSPSRLTALSGSSRTATLAG